MSTLVPPADPAAAVRRHLRLGYLLTFLLVFGLGGWAFAAEISGAIIASGLFTVESSIKKVQHPTGGIIGSIEVREGQPVKAGDVLLRLDPTLTRANLAIVGNMLAQQTARQARLEAERDGRDAIAWPAGSDTASNGEGARLMRSEERLHDLRRTAREGQIAQLRERVRQLEDEIRGQIEQQQAKDREIALIERELQGVRELYAKNLIPVSRVTALERDSARLNGERGALISSTSAARGRINETNLQGIQIEQQFRSDVAKELRETQDRIAELAERHVTALDQLQRIELKAPQDGFVHNLAVFTVGGVINAGETVMTIVPSRDKLAIDVRILPNDISSVHVDQPVTVRLSAFESRSTPTVEGVVARVGADISRDERTGATFYSARISLDADQLARIGDQVILPGMPAEVFIKTGDRTVLSYLTKPVIDQVMRAFRGS